jgi:hypothetical protein
VSRRLSLISFDDKTLNKYPTTNSKFDNDREKQMNDKENKRTRSNACRALYAHIRSNDVDLNEIDTMISFVEQYDDLSI